MKKIALLIPYFGKLPDYFPFYLHSLKYVNGLDVYLFTDCQYHGDIPDNCYFIKYSLSKFKNSIREKLSIDCEINKPIKICDFRPAYAILFSKYIKSYRFWSFGDIDVVYGNLFRKLPADWQSYDVISMLNTWVSGSFFILRNDKNINELFMKSNSWKEVFSSKKHYAYDECNHLYQEIISGMDILDIDKKQSFTYVLKNEAKKNNISAYFSDSLIKEDILNKQFILFDNGTISCNDNHEYAYFHLIKQKQDPAFNIPNWNLIPNKYYIDKYGIAKENEYFELHYRFASRIRGNYLRLIYNVMKLRKIPNKTKLLFRRIVHRRPSEKDRNIQL